LSFLTACDIPAKYFSGIATPDRARNDTTSVRANNRKRSTGDLSLCEHRVEDLRQREQRPDQATRGPSVRTSIAALNLKTADKLLK
jgi:hypothetical protein